jgi:putative membrane protein
VSSQHAEAGVHPRAGAIALWLSIFAGVTVWSFVAPKDRLTWWLEAIPALAALALIAATWRTFPLTRLVYWLILCHCLVLFVGAHYTYAEVPLFEWFRGSLGFTRNNYDKLGHFVQGFAPAVIAREILLRKRVLTRGAWLNFLIVCIVLAISATYEMIEWLVALQSAQASAAFLGTQGYEWDTQSDMLMALVGGVLSLAIWPRLHDRQLAVVDPALRSP